MTEQHELFRDSVKESLAKAKQELASWQGNSSKKLHLVIGNESADLDSITSAIVYGYFQTVEEQAKGTTKIWIPVVNIPREELPLRLELDLLLDSIHVKLDELITIDDLRKPLRLDEISSLSKKNLGKPYEGHLDQKIEGELRELIAQTEWTLVDHNKFKDDLSSFRSAIVAVVDHHKDEHYVPYEAELAKGAEKNNDYARPHLLKTIGSCNSLIAQRFRSQQTTLGKTNLDRACPKGSIAAQHAAELARLSLAAVLIDTANEKDKGKLTHADVEIINYLIHIIGLDDTRKFDRTKFFEALDKAKNDFERFTVEQILAKDYKELETENGLKVGMAVAVQSVGYLRENKSDHVETAMSKFAKKKDCDIMILMTAFQDEQKKDGFGKELVIVVLDGSEKAESARQAVESFIKMAKGEADYAPGQRLAPFKENGKAAENKDAVLCLRDYRDDEPGQHDKKRRKAEGLRSEHAWVQVNITPSRKQIAPLMVAAMNAVER